MVPCKTHLGLQAVEVYRQMMPIAHTASCIAVNDNYFFQHCFDTSAVRSQVRHYNACMEIQNVHSPSRRPSDAGFDECHINFSASNLSESQGRSNEAFAGVLHFESSQHGSAASGLGPYPNRRSNSFSCARGRNGRRFPIVFADKGFAHFSDR